MEITKGYIDIGQIETLLKEYIKTLEFDDPEDTTKHYYETTKDVLERVWPDFVKWLWSI